MTSIIIPAKVAYIYQEAFAGNSKMESVKVLPETPPFLYDNSFSNYNIPLYAPATAVETYKETSPWSKFAQFLTLDGTEVETQQCATPTIAFVDGKLTFSCETEDVEYVYEIQDADIKRGNGSEVSLTCTYQVSVYATKAGYLNSEVATMNIDMRAGGVKGDVNGDGVVNVTDVTNTINIILGKE